MSQNLLGVKPTAPGFAEFEIKPMLTETLSAVSGTVPTVLGAFEVDIDLRGKRVMLDVPDGA